MEAQIKVIIVESSDIMLQGFEFMLKEEQNIIVTNMVSRLKDFSYAVKNYNYDVVLLGPMIGENLQHDLAEAISEKYPDIRLVEIEYEDDNVEIVGKIMNSVYKVNV